MNGIQLKINGKILDHEYYGIIDGEHCVSVDSVCLDTPRTELLIRCPELRSHAQTDDVFQDTRMK